METVGQRIDRVRAPGGFDYLRIGLSFAVILWHSIVSSYGAEVQAYFWVHWRFIPGNILPMFFALSGFLVAGSWERTRNLPLFFGYRAVRLIPALTVEVVLSALLLGPMLTTLPLHSCSIPCDHIPRRSWPLFRARDLLRGVIESFQREQVQ